MLTKILSTFSLLIAIAVAHRGGTRGGGRFGFGGGDIEWVESLCDLSDISGPECASNREGDLGVWVQRVTYNPITGEANEPRTLCIDPERGLDTDICGCGDNCPEACACTCTTRDAEDGVLVQRAGADANARSLCIPEPNAMALIGRGAVECATCEA